MQSILAVDDSAFMRKLVAHTLTRVGYRVLEAVDGQDALDVLNQAGSAVGLVLADQNMPRLDGIGLTRCLRADERWRHLPVLMLTTDSDEQIKQAGREAGATGWLVKPFEPVRLIEVIKQVLGA